MLQLCYIVMYNSIITLHANRRSMPTGMEEQQDRTLKTETSAAAAPP